MYTQLLRFSQQRVFKSLKAITVGSVVLLSTFAEQSDAVELPGNIDNSFNPGSGTNERVYAIEIQEDNKILIGGLFTQYNAQPAGGLARLLPDGSIDNSFTTGSGISGGLFTFVNDIAIQPDGKIIVCGDFTSYNGTSTGNVVRLETDGTIDTSFAIGTGANYGVNDILLLPDGKILLGGTFTQFNGTSKSRIVRLDANGTLDSSFSPGGMNGRIEKMARQEDGKIILAGSFTTFDSVAHGRIVRITADGLLDTTFNTGAGFSNFLETLYIQNDGKILCGGYFSNYNGTARRGIARLNSDGSLDDLSVDLRSGERAIFGIIQDSQNRILMSGSFGQVGGRRTGTFARLLPDGSLDETYQNDLPANWISPIALQEDNRILLSPYDVGPGILRVFGDDLLPPPDPSSLVVTPSYHHQDGAINQLIWPINQDYRVLGYAVERSSDGVSWSEIRQFDYTSTVPSSQTYYDNIVIGNETSYYRVRVRNLGGYSEYSDPVMITSALPPNLPETPRFNPRVDSSTEITVFPFTNNYTRSFELWHSFDGTTGWRLISTTLNGSNFNLNGMLPGSSHYFQLRAVNELGYSASLVETRTLYGGFGPGSIDPSFPDYSSWGGRVWSSDVQADGKILVGGSFTNNNNMVRLNSNGTVDAAFDAALGSGPNSTVRAIHPLISGQILIGGSFTSVSENTAPRIAQLNNDGNIDETFNVGTGPNDTVLTITSDAEGQILIGGEFTSFDGTERPAIARINANGTLDTSFTSPLIAGSTVEVSDIKILPDGKILVAGSFDVEGLNGRKHLVRLHNDGTVDSSFEPTTFAHGPSVVHPLANGTILLAGSSTRFNDTRCSYLGRLNNDGSFDTSFYCDWPRGLSDDILDMKVQADGRLLTAGLFRHYSGIPHNYIARLEPDGMLDTSFNPGIGPNSLVQSLELLGDGRCFIGGLFTTVDGLPTGPLAVMYLAPPSDAPPIPQNLRTETISDSEVQILWNDGPNETGYRIMRSPNGIDGWTLVTTTTADATSFTDSGLFSGADYHYLIQAENANYTTSYSETVTGHTSGSFADWKAWHGIAPETSSNDDNDGDGVQLFLEFALLMDPHISSNEGLPVINTNSDNLTLTYTRGRRSLTYQVYSSTDLVEWITTDVDQGEPGAIVTASTPKNAPVKFLILRVSEQ